MCSIYCGEVNPTILMNMDNFSFKPSSKMTLEQDNLQICPLITNVYKASTIMSNTLLGSGDSSVIPYGTEMKLENLDPIA